MEECCTVVRDDLEDERPLDPAGSFDGVPPNGNVGAGAVHGICVEVVLFSTWDISCLCEAGVESQEGASLLRLAGRLVSELAPWWSESRCCEVRVEGRDGIGIGVVGVGMTGVIGASVRVGLRIETSEMLGLGLLDDPTTLLTPLRHKSANDCKNHNARFIGPGRNFTYLM